MGIESAIAWTKSTFNPWQGCTKVGPGCDHCYAAAADQRFHKGIHWGAGAPRKTMSESTWNNPLRWNRDAAKTGEFWPVFCASHADVFDTEADPALRARLFKIIRETPYLTWQLLTKRIGNVAAMLPADWGDGYPNVWLGATFVNQAELNRDYRKLVSTSAVKRLASIEPMLAAMHLRRIKISVDREIDALTGEEFCTAHLTRRFVRYWPALDWVIAGGESGVGARVAHPTWYRSLRDDCEATGTAFLFKQWGEYRPAASVAEASSYPIIASNRKEEHAPGQPAYGFPNISGCFHTRGQVESMLDGSGEFARFDCAMVKVGTKHSGNRLDGRQHLAFPDALQPRPRLNQQADASTPHPIVHPQS